MSRELPLPVRRALREPWSDDAMERLVSTAVRREPARRGPAKVLAASVIAVAAAVAISFAWPRTRIVGPLHDASGAVLADRLDARVPTSVGLDDGSTIVLGEDARLVTLENDAHDASFLLEDGTATFDVRPHGPRRWSIECGLATVTVIGTRFTIARDAHQLDVSVERGVVLVRGELVPEHARRLAAGERITLSDVETPAPLAVVPPATEVEEPAPVVRPARVPAPTPWRALAEETRWDEAYRALGPTGVAGASDVASVADLLVLADVARLSGHLADAVVPLERVVREHPDDPNASLAAFSLGRIEDRLSQPDRAARAFESALTLGHLPTGLRGDAVARRTASLEAAGDHAAAVQSARAYLEEQPNGSEVSAMRAIAERP